MADIIPIRPQSVGEVANQYAAENMLSGYRGRRSKQTTRRQKVDLALFADYLHRAGMLCGNLFEDLDEWRGITHGLVDGFVLWMLREGYAVGSVNVRLATVRRYCQLAARAGKIKQEEYSLIMLVKGYSQVEGRNIDETRPQTRRSTKKAEPVSISREQSTALKSQPDTPQGRRDALLMCLLLDHGLRCGEVAALTPENISLSDNRLSFYRQKVDKHQIHALTPDTRKAALRYFEVCNPQGRLLIGSRKGGAMIGIMSSRAITARARELGERIGVHGLGAHDGRHRWATAAARSGTSITDLQQAGGWNNITTPAKYIEQNTIANEGVKLE